MQVPAVGRQAPPAHVPTMIPSMDQAAVLRLQCVHESHVEPVNWSPGPHPETLPQQVRVGL